MGEESPTESFKPIYGWGWRQGDTSLDVPPPFDIAVDDRTGSSMVGTIRAPHQFSGCHIKLFRRATSEKIEAWDAIISGNPLTETITGYVESSR